MPLPPRAARHWQPSGAATAVSVRLDATGKAAARCAGRFSLTAEATVDDKTAILSSSRLTAGPLGLAAAGRYDRAGRSARRHGDRPIRRAGPARADPAEASPGAACDLTAHAVLRQPGEAARRHGDAERRRRRSRGCRARRSFARLRSHHARRHARRAARRQPDARCAERDHGRGFRDGRRRLVPAQDRGRRGQGDGRAAQPGAVLGAGPTPARRARPSRPVGAARWRRPDVRLAGHA